ncbi:MAG: MOSC domain-containing protein [Acidimicrobiia bacterium]|nr:MOSC domain-containing protein [Acidimicrobiia bacterium]
MPHVEAIHIGEHKLPAPLESVTEVEAVAGRGLRGDRKFDAFRQISIVSSEELAEAAAAWGGEIPVGATRRQITISDGRFNRTPGTIIRLGEVEVEVNGDCSPCREMSETIGPDVREHLRYRAGITGSVVKGGTIRVGDQVEIN